MDPTSWQIFTGLTGHRHLPDARTIWAFKEMLAREGGAEAVLEMPKAKGLIDRVQRKDDPNRCDQTGIHARNRTLSRIRSRVEHVFGDWAQSSGKTLRCIGKVRAKAQTILRACVYNLRRWVTLDRRGACGA
ncbi:MAG: transposase [Betaproteobacteria bacterium]|nr:transposase [Betaproteobacteria bacterium]